MITRRGLITGLISFVAAPAIVRASSLMPVKAVKIDAISGMDIYFKYMHVRPEWLTFLGDEVIKLIPEHYNT